MAGERSAAGAAQRLDGEKCAVVWKCLAKKRAAPTQGRFDRFIRDIEAAVDALPRDAQSAKPFRDAHEALRELWMLSHEDDDHVQIGVLRRQIRSLPSGAVEYLDRRAPIVIPSLFPDEQVSGFQDWAARAGGQKLKVATGVLSAEGAKIVEGRSRGGGRRSGRRLEPIIMGEARGAGARVHRGGRPTNEADQILVMKLAIAWLEATDTTPTSGRSDRSGFGYLVHAIFEWLERPSWSADYALRQYWAAVKENKARKPREDSNGGVE
jgi:hypothetical protein